VKQDIFQLFYGFKFTSEFFAIQYEKLRRMGNQYGETNTWN